MTETNWKDTVPNVAAGVTALAASWWMFKWASQNPAEANEKTTPEVVEDKEESKSEEKELSIQEFKSMIEK